MLARFKNWFLSLAELTIDAINERFIMPTVVRRRQTLLDACEHLIKGFESHNIEISAFDVSDGGFSIVTLPNTAQEPTYARIVAETLTYFPDLSAFDVCHRLSPLQPLDEHWAQTYGIRDWACSVDPTCKRCGVTNDADWQFGKALADSARRIANAKYTIISVEHLGFSIRLFGYYCDDCHNQIRSLREERHES